MLLIILWNLADLQLDQLMQDACTQVEDYLKYNAPEGDKLLCEGSIAFLQQYPAIGNCGDKTEVRLRGLN
ncbi:MAG TPA: hypothetical protein DD379_26965 [Cyanobacteria bacterium UBA11162]|nr:hypothetical protein [Cyanobacteria bacterium UBA11162]